MFVVDTEGATVLTSIVPVTAGIERMKSLAVFVGLTVIDPPDVALSMRLADIFIPYVAKYMPVMTTLASVLQAGG